MTRTLLDKHGYPRPSPPPPDILDPRMIFKDKTIFIDHIDF